MSNFNKKTKLSVERQGFSQKKEKKLKTENKQSE
jgi:hypothetical protein